MSDTGTTLTAVAPGAYVVEADGRALPVVALSSYMSHDGTVYTEPVVISASGRLATPSELDCEAWTMRPTGPTGRAR